MVDERGVGDMRIVTADHFSVSWVVENTREVRLERVSAAGPAVDLLMPGYLTEHAGDVGEDEESELAAELYDANGALLMRYGLTLLDYRHLGRANADRAVRGHVPFPAGTRAIRYVRRGVTLHEIAVSESAPVVELHRRSRTSGGRRVAVAWSARHAEKRPLQFFLRYSHDGGATWRRVSSRVIDHVPGAYLRRALAVVQGRGEAVRRETS